MTSAVASAVTGALTAAVDTLAGLDPTGLCITELQSVLTALTPALGRLTGVRSDLLGELQARSGGTVPSAAGPDGAPGPDIAVRPWLREVSGCDAAPPAQRYGPAFGVTRRSA